MQHITDRLPDLDIYQSVYADAHLGRLLADAYVHVICFSRSSIEYFESHGYSESPIHRLPRHCCINVKMNNYSSMEQ